MAEGSESDYRLLPSLNISTRSVLNQKIVIYKASVMRSSLLITQLIGRFTVGNQQKYQ